MTKPNCYECKWRGDLAGDAHSCCNHPVLGEVCGDPILNVIAALANVTRVDKLGIKFNYHGIKHEWFNFPWNFDPVWLEECNGFTAKEEK